MHRLTSLLLIAVIGIAGYNFWQLERMRSDMRAIRAKVHIDDVQKSKDSKPPEGILVVLADVKKHSRNARELMERGEYKKARRELEMSLRRLERASEISSELAADADSGLGKTWSKVRYQVLKTWKEISEDRGKGG